MSLYGKRKKAKYKSYKGETGKIAPNVIDRDFIGTAPNQKWTTDVTEVKIKDKKIYLSPILDMLEFSRRYTRVRSWPHCSGCTRN